MRIKFEVEGKVQVREIPDEEIGKVLELHKKEREQKEINENTIVEVRNVVATLKQQLNELETTVEGLNKNIKASEDKIDEAI